MHYRCNFKLSHRILLVAVRRHSVEPQPSRIQAKLGTRHLRQDGAAASAKKTQNDLFLPPTQALKARLTIGERRFPATEDLQGIALFYRKLLQGLGKMSVTAPAISRQQFKKSSFMATFDLEAAPKIQHSGISTPNAPLNVFSESLFTSVDPTPVTQMYLQTTSDVLMEVNRRGVLISV